ncbi:MAG: chromosome segregation protein SMC [Desulfobacterales bacterium]|jgi:chromosome segregation protein
MKLKKLEINGFKSFIDKASISFPSGISAVVGPNGCGKSNILDALRWVMGEQSVKQLRGKSMEDIIFAGASGKPPTNLAEVSLTLLNDNGSAPEEWRDYSEIMITRRLYRSGESAYFINKQPCRLKDILNVFLGSGLGSKSYAIIQQGNIGAITDAGPDERRLFIEEAAGVTRFKQRRTEALRKLNATNQNLYRLNDIVSEIKRQMSGLKRQARKAELYNSFQERIKDLDVRLSIHRFDEFTRHYDDARNRLMQLKDVDLSHANTINTIDAAVEDIKLRRFQKSQEVAEQRSRQFDLQRSIDKLESGLSHMTGDGERLSAEIGALEETRGQLAGKNTKIAEDIVEVDQQKTAIESDILDIRKTLEREQTQSTDLANHFDTLKRRLDADKNRLMELVAQEAKVTNIHLNAQNNKESLKRRLKRIDEEVVQASRSVVDHTAAERERRESLAVVRRDLDQLDTRLTDIRARLEVKGKALSTQVKTVHTLELERGDIRSRYQALKKMETNLDWYRDGVKAILKVSGDNATRLPGVRGIVADALQPEPGYEAAVEAALGEWLQFVMVDDQSTGLEAMTFLQSRSAGRCGFVPLASVRGMDAHHSLELPSGTSRLLDHVTVAPEYQTAAEALLGHVVVAESASAAVLLFNQNGAVRSLVTVSGDVVTHQGLMSGGGAEKLSGILEKKQEIHQLEESLAVMDHRVTDARGHQDLLETETRHLEIDLQGLVEERNTLSQDVMEEEQRLYKATEDLKNARRRLEIVQLEQEQLLGEESDIDDEIARHHELLAQVSSEVKAAQDQVSSNSVESQTLARQMEAFNQKVTDIKLQLTAMNAKLESSASTLRRLKEFQEDGSKRYNDLLEEVAAKKNRLAGIRQKSRDDRETLALRYDELNQLTQHLELNEVEYQEIDHRLKERDAEIAELKTRREKTLENLRLLELEASELNLKRENISQRIEERYHRPLIQFKADLPVGEGDNDWTVEAMEAELERCRKKIAAIQDVNLGAIKEYEQLKTRFDFLCAQRDDLNQAIEDLHKVIRKINRITQERFLDTLNQVNEKLVEVFPRLFQGGSAKLVMTDPSQPLDTGVEFMIHPPGKQLTRMSLLSGGEKALSAIAFIFSIFLMRPTSFCLLDEIDAPLDDANVSRFNNLLKTIGENSQIIMITHNKRSMEFADTLFGITMEKKGISKVVSVNLESSAA